MRVMSCRINWLNGRNPVTSRPWDDRPSRLFRNGDAIPQCYPARLRFIFKLDLTQDDMKCFEVVVNGGEPATVGASEGGLISGSFVLSPSGGAGLVFSVEVETGPAQSERREWASGPLDLGDEVTVRVIESEHPSEPLKRSVHGTAVDPEAPNLACSVCRRSREMVSQLLAVGPFSICGECVELCYESLGRRNAG